MNKYALIILSSLLFIACAKNGSNGRNGSDGNTGRISVYDSNDNFLGYSLVMSPSLFCVSISTEGFYCFSGNGMYFGTVDSGFGVANPNGCHYTDGSCSGTCYVDLTTDLQRGQIIPGNAFSYFKYVGSETEVTNLAVQTCWNGATCGACATTLAKAAPLSSSVTMDSKYHTISVPIYLDWD